MNTRERYLAAYRHQPVDRAAHGGGYILSPSGRIDPETPEENLYAFTGAAR